MPIAKASRSKKTSRSKAKRAARQPVLLAGGNPRIAKGVGAAPVQAYIAAMPGWKRDVGRRLDALIVRTVPGVSRAVKWNSPFYGVESQGWFIALHCFTRYVKVVFFRGTLLRPPPPGESKREELRYLDIREDEPLDEGQMSSWIRQAAAIPGWNGGFAAQEGGRMEPKRRVAGGEAALAMSRDVQQLFGNYPEAVRELMTGARQLLFSELPGVKEFPDVKTRVIGYGTGESYRETIATLVLSKGGVKIGIVGGATLPDPAHLLEGAGKVHRYVAIEKPADLKSPALRSLVRKAYAAWKKR